MEKDYDQYTFGRGELVKNVLLYLAVCEGIGWLFYHSLLAGAAFWPGLVWFLKNRKKTYAARQKRELLAQFLTAMQSVSKALEAGYSMENAFREAGKETEKVYGTDSLMALELQGFVRKMEWNETLENLLCDFGKRSHLEDVENFGEIFSVARKMGGNLKVIIRNTTENIKSKTETQEEIAVSLAGKVMEQRTMSLIPCGILFYVNLASPEFLKGMYHNPLGVCVMTICLFIYGAAFLWGRRIVAIEV